MSKNKVICDGLDVDSISIEDVIIWLEDHMDEPFCEDVYELLDELDGEDDDDNWWSCIIHQTLEDAYEILVDKYDGVYAPLNIRIK